MGSNSRHSEWIPSPRVMALVEKIAHRAVGQGVLGVEVDGPRYSGDGLVQPALGIQGIAEVVVGHGVLGVEASASVLGDGLVQLPLGTRASPRL